MFQFDPTAYGTACTRLLQHQRMCPLGPGKPVAALRAPLEALDVAAVTGDQPIQDRNMALCCVSALWLYHNFLDESHTISQGIPSATGSYWHGIMHRREGDYQNAKYWFRRTGEHPIFERLSVCAARLATAQGDLDTTFLTEQPRWNPLLFVDLCHKVIGRGNPGEEVCRHVAHLEWQLLFDFCYRQAIGTCAD